MRKLQYKNSKMEKTVIDKMQKCKNANMKNKKGKIKYLKMQN